MKRSTYCCTGWRWGRCWRSCFVSPKTFDLIANTQRELRRALHHLGERHAAEPGVDNAFRGSAMASAPLSAHRNLAHQSP